MENTYKIILTDNLNRSYPPSDTLIAQNMIKCNADELCNELNKKHAVHSSSSMRYKVVSMDYKLYNLMDVK
jgi:hypothetical protein